MYKYNIVLMSYIKDVLCIMDEDRTPICQIFESTGRRNSPSNIPSHEPYLPTIQNAVFYNCTSEKCEPVKINSITQITLPEAKLKMCYTQNKQKYSCQPLKYLYYKDIDKLLFLINNIPGKTFYFVDCLAYLDGGRVCHKKDDANSHSKLVSTGTIVRPNETNVLSQEEFICEQDEAERVICDLNQYVPYVGGLHKKQSMKADQKIILKVGASLIILKYNCIGSWCGYTGNFKYKLKTRRDDNVGRVYRCYYANKQQVCKLIKGIDNIVFNELD